MLDADAVLDPPPHRMLVAGPSGSGKSVLARRIESITGLPYTELDSLFHGPGWTELPGFAGAVDTLTLRPRWTTEWQYTTQLGDLLPSRADTVVWLDLSIPVHLSRLVSRTIRRRVQRIELWNGNLEPPLRSILWNPDHIIRWGWRGRGKLRTRMGALEADHPHLRVVRLRSQSDVERWLAGLSKAGDQV